MISVNKGIMIASAGIDESNGNGYFVLWPKNPQESSNHIREYLIKKYNLKYLGIVITDSKLTPFRWGVTGVSLAHSGFRALNNYIGKPDIFGRKLRAEKSNVADTLATSAVGEIGGENEKQPFAVITDAAFVQFQKRNPSRNELNGLKISLEDDVYSSLLTSIKWQRRCK